jgi:hypothetical protein
MVFDLASDFNQDIHPSENTVIEVVMSEQEDLGGWEASNAETPQSANQKSV